MKRAMIILLILLLPGICLADAGAALPSDFLFSYQDDAAVLVSYGGDAERVQIPETIDGRPVTVIGEGAFKDCTWVEEVIVPGSVWYIDEEAFSDCSMLARIVLPANLSEIRAWAFKNCRSLTSIELPENLSVLGTGAFMGCTGLGSIRIPYGVWHLLTDTFSGCTALAKVRIMYPGISIDDGSIPAGAAVTIEAEAEMPDDFVVEAADEPLSLDRIPLSMITPAPRGELHPSLREPTGNTALWRRYLRRWGSPPGHPRYERYWRPDCAHYYDADRQKYGYWPHGWRWQWGPPLWGNLTLDEAPKPTVDVLPDGTVVAIETEVGYFGLMSVRLMVVDDVIISAEAYEQFSSLEDGVQELYEAVAGRFVGELATRTGQAYIMDMRREKCSKLPEMMGVHVDSGIEMSLSALLRAVKKAAKSASDPDAVPILK